VTETQAEHVASFGVHPLAITDAILGLERRNVRPKTGGLLVTKSVQAIRDIDEWYVLHASLLFQRTCLRIFYDPEARIEVVDYIQCALYQRCAGLEVPLVTVQL
jgi:hypothetical protein